MGLNDLLDKTVRVNLSGEETPGTVSPIGCAIAPADLRTVMEYAQQGVTAVYLVYSSVDLGASAGDQLTIDGTTYPVVAVRSFANSMVGPPIFVTVCGAAAA